MNMQFVLFTDLSNIGFGSITQTVDSDYLRQHSVVQPFNWNKLSKNKGGKYY